MLLAKVAVMVFCSVVACSVLGPVKDLRIFNRSSRVERRSSQEPCNAFTETSDLCTMSHSVPSLVGRRRRGFLGWVSA